MNEPQTLLWIGERTSPEFAKAYAYCESNAAQVAFRSNLKDAVLRPAMGVSNVLVTQSTRRSLDAFALMTVAEKYRDAATLKLQGSFCEGMRTSLEPAFDAVHYWHQWNQVLPPWLGGKEDEPESGAPLVRSVAVVAQNFDSGDALLDLADTTGVTTLWCPGGNAGQVRNVDVVWWDDSVATPVSSRGWEQRISKFNAGQNAQHVWIASAPRVDQQLQATRGGIVSVISKPLRIECLLSSLGGQSAAATSLVKAA
ncbi:MAG: hypothetical protein AB8B91_20975 [Rubripirellula sp.]